MGTQTGHACLYAEYGIWADGIEKICSISKKNIENFKILKS